MCYQEQQRLLAANKRKVDCQCCTCEKEFRLDYIEVIWFKTPLVSSKVHSLEKKQQYDLDREEPPPNNN